MIGVLFAVCAECVTEQALCRIGLALLRDFPVLIALDALVMFTVNKLFYHSVFVPFIKYPRNIPFTIETIMMNLTRGIKHNLYPIL